MKFPFGVFAGGLLGALLFGKPSPSSPIGKAIQWIATTADENKPSLYYFDIRGRAEAIRIALADREIEYNDSSFTSEEWGRNSPDGLKAKWVSEGKLMFGQVPMLEIDGINIVQSHAILRYLATKYGWYDSYDAATLARIDMAGDGTEDIRKVFSTIKYGNLEESEKQVQYKEYLEGDGVKWFGYYEKMAANSNQGFIAGTNEPTHADYLLYDLMDTVEGLCAEHARPLFNTLSNLSALRTRLSNRPGIAAYLKSSKRRS